LTASSGGPYPLYATGITTTTFDMTVPLPTNSFAVPPTTVNTTGLTWVMPNSGPTINITLQLMRAAKNGNLQAAYSFLREVVANFSRGEPMNWEGEMMKLRHAHTVFATLATACSEIGTLLDANPGTLTTAATGIGGRKAVRTQP
jgi:hypothetical protein